MVFSIVVVIVSVCPIYTKNRPNNQTSAEQLCAKLLESYLQYRIIHLTIQQNKEEEEEEEEQLKEEEEDEDEEDEEDEDHQHPQVRWIKRNTDIVGN